MKVHCNKDVPSLPIKDVAVLMRRGICIHHSSRDSAVMMLHTDTCMAFYALRDGVKEMKNRISKPYTCKLIEGQTSGYGEVRLYPCCNRSCRRQRRYQRSIQALQSAYNKRSAHTCYVEAVENFGSHDYFLTITFSPDTDDKNRLELLKRVIRYLQRRCNQHGTTLKYIYNWGRGEIDEQLHCHMFINNVVAYSDLIACCNTYKNVNINIQYIEYPHYNTEEENIRHIVYYVFYKHWDSLEQEDKNNLVQKRYYGSRSLNKMTVTEKDDDEIDRDIVDSPTKIMEAIVNASDYDEIDAIVQKVFNGYHLEGFYYDEGNSPICADTFGTLFGKLKLVKIGSKLDNPYIYRNGHVINRYTGEVIEE